MSSKITIRPVTQPSELAGLGLIQEKGLEGDGLDYYARLSNKSVLPRVLFQNSVERNFKEGLDHVMILRAIEEEENGGGDLGEEKGEGKTVGFACWYFGTGATRHPNHESKKGDEESSKATEERKGEGEGQLVVPVAPPTIPPVDPKEIEKIEKAALEEQAAEDGTMDETQKAKEERKIERAAEVIATVLRPWGEWYDKLMTGKQHIYLRQMYVLPSHQGRGIASHFMRWGCEKADQNGWPGFLIATAAGRPVYLKYGFYDRQVFEVPKPDLESEDGSDRLLGTHKSYIMLRDPRKLEK